MLFIDVLRISSRSFKNNRLRTLLTILGISIGIGAIFFLVSLGDGFQKIILEKIATEDSLLALDVTQKNEAIILNQESIDSVKEIGEVKEVLPLISQDSEIISNGLTSHVKINIVDPKFFSLEGIETNQGVLFKIEENDKMVVSLATLQLLDIKEADYKNKEVVVKLVENSQKEQAKNLTETGNTTEVILEKPQENLENVVYVEKKYTISGVIEDSTNAYAYIPNSSVAEMVFDNYDKLKVKVDSTNNLEQTRNKIIDKGFFVSSVSETVDQARQIFTIAQIILVLFGIVALLVSAIGMFNTMTIALLERTQEIGIMKAIGASVYDIWKMFLMESMMIGFLGGVIGVLLGYALSKILNFTINWLAGMFGGVGVELFFIRPQFVIFIISFSTIVGIITGFYPAKRAAKLNALEALRYK